MNPRLKILWVKSGPLHPLDTGGKKRTYHMVRELHRQYEVTFLSLCPKDTPTSALADASNYSSKQIWIDWKAPNTAWTALKNGFLSSYPFVLEKYLHAPLRAKIQALDDAQAFDLIVCDFLTLAPSFAPKRDGGTPRVLFQHNMEAQIWDRLAAAHSNPLVRWYFRRQYHRMRRWERVLSERFDGVITVSEDDTAYAQREYRLGNVLGSVPTGVDFDYFHHPTRVGGDGRVIGFLGSMDWMPNIEAVTFFTEKIFPHIKDRLPGAQLVIIGRNPTARVRALAETDPAIDVTGTVDDVRPFLGKCDVLAVPLLSGGGTRIKIMEAVAAGLPVVSTTVGAEGLELEAGKEIEIADDPQTFAEAVLQLCERPERREDLAHAALIAAKRRGSWEHCTNIFMEHCLKVMKG